MAKFKLSKKERAEISRRLRYMSAENLARDFKSPAERRAMLAVFEWIALCGVCAWPLRKPGNYRTGVNFRSRAPHTKIVLDDSAFEKARKLLEKKPRSKSGVAGKVTL